MACASDVSVTELLCCRDRTFSVSDRMVSVIIVNI